MCQSSGFGGINDQAGHWSVNHVPSTNLSGSTMDVLIWEILVVPSSTFWARYKLEIYFASTPPPHLAPSRPICQRGAFESVDLGGYHLGLTIIIMHDSIHCGSSNCAARCKRYLAVQSGFLCRGQYLVGGARCG